MFYSGLACLVARHPIPFQQEICLPSKLTIKPHIASTWWLVGLKRHSSIPNDGVCSSALPSGDPTERWLLQAWLQATCQHTWRASSCERKHLERMPLLSTPYSKRVRNCSFLEVIKAKALFWIVLPWIVLHLPVLAWWMWPLQGDPLGGESPSSSWELKWKQLPPHLDHPEAESWKNMMSLLKKLQA